jgi:hypothetical protein
VRDQVCGCVIVMYERGDLLKMYEWIMKGLLTWDVSRTLASASFERGAASRNSC